MVLKGISNCSVDFNQILCFGCYPLCLYQTAGAPKAFSRGSFSHERNDLVFCCGFILLWCYF